ncbi:hypothetical protein PFISCL1PPCAC_3206, partial [Pristionchus fissidentatus]
VDRQLHLSDAIRANQAAIEKASKEQDDLGALLERVRERKRWNEEDVSLSTLPAEIVERVFASLSLVDRTKARLSKRLWRIE